jgi:DNA-binding CsgD family transcriptional regulator
MTAARTGSDTLDLVRRWLSSGHDVVLRGERGIGKSAALESVRADLSERRLMAVLLRASGPGPFAAVLDHPSAPPRVPDEASMAAWLADELAAPRSALLVDDVDRLDPGSLRVIQRVLARTGCRLVAASTTDLLRARPGTARDLLVARVPEELRLPPLDLPEVAALAAHVLGAPVDAELAATLHAQSGGNPGVAMALLATGRAAGVLDRVDSRFVDAGRLADVEAGSLVTLLLAHLDAEHVDAAERLAVLGPVPLDAAARLVRPELVADLADAGRVTVRDAAGARALATITPPALARALRGRVPAHRRARLVSTARDMVGPALLAVEPAPVDLAALLASDARSSTDYLRWSSQLTAVLHERAAAEEAAAHAAWVAVPCLRTANAYLAHLMRRPARDQIAAVLRTARRTGADTADDAVTHRYYRARWAAWHGSDARDLPEPADDDDLGPADDDLATLASLDGLKERLVAALRDGRSAEQVAEEDAPPLRATVLRGGPHLMRAAALIETGRPDLALEVCDRAAQIDGVTGETEHYLAALRAQSLLLLRRTDAARRLAHDRLSTAYDHHDVFGVRVHATVLAEVLCLTGEPEDAWRVLSTALRLGPPGPGETTFYRRGLTLGAALQSAAGQVPLAVALLDELEKTPRDHRPLLRSLRVRGAVGGAVAAGARATGTEIAWTAGTSYAEAGLRGPALMAWAFAPPPFTVERAEVIRATRRGVVLPLLDPYLDVQLALADRDEDAVAAALPGVDASVAGTLSGAAHALLGTGRDWALPARTAPARPEPLSYREREVAGLGREGLSNREIADRLGLSIRTVENHMSRALRKLGYRTRLEMRRADHA